MTGPVQRPWWREGLMLSSLGLAGLAVVALALGGNDPRLLRLGIVAGLWAALLGAFAVARARRDTGSGPDRAEELRTIYQLELEREIAARREHELTVERELREQLERRERTDIADLRADLQSFQETLKKLIGGDVMVERVALRAESTRLLSLPEHSRAFTDSRGRVSAGEAAPLGLAVSEWPVAHDSAAAPADTDPPPTGQSHLATDPIGGRRRRRVEPDPLSPTAGQPPVNSGGPPPGSPAEPRTRQPKDQSPGAHRGGRSVADLLASYGKDPAPSRHRRRQDG